MIRNSAIVDLIDNGFGLNVDRAACDRNALVHLYPLERKCGRKGMSVGSSGDIPSSTLEYICQH